MSGREILPLPAPGVTQPVTFPGRNSSGCASRSCVFWTASQPCPASQIIDQEETLEFQKLPQKGTEPARLPCVTRAVFIHGFSEAFSRAGSPRRDPGRISPLSDSRSHTMGIRAAFHTLHFSTLIHATPGE